MKLKGNWWTYEIGHKIGISKVGGRHDWWIPIPMDWSECISIVWIPIDWYGLETGCIRKCGLMFDGQTVEDSGWNVMGTYWQDFGIDTSDMKYTRNLELWWTKNSDKLKQVKTLQFSYGQMF